MRVAHFSDIHLLSFDGVRLSDFLDKRITGAVNLLLNRGGLYPLAVAEALVADVNRQEVDHAILSGDLTNLAFPAEFELGRRLLAGLELGPHQITVVPGNHDYYTRRSVVDDHFGRAMEKYLQGDRRPGPRSFPLLRLQGELAVLALSTAIPSAPLLAIGSLGAQQLQQAEELLGSDDCRGRFRLVVIHHPPQDPHIRWHNRLIDKKPFLEMLVRTGAELVVHGHLHRFFRQELPGRGPLVPLIGVGSGTWLSPDDAERRAQYNLYELEGPRLLRVRRRRYDPTRRIFEEL